MGPTQGSKNILKKDEIAGVIQQNFVAEVVCVMDHGAFWTAVVRREESAGFEEKWERTMKPVFAGSFDLNVT